MRDSFDRNIDYLRISVTDRCNYRCWYCMPEGFSPLAHRDDILSFEEIVQIAQLANQLGITKFRITGGEPLLRRNLADLVRMLKDNCVVYDLSMTTNGHLFPKYARELEAAGLDRVNISIDTLQPDKFKRITRGGNHERVLESIDTALELDLQPVKTNTVVMGGVNDDEIHDFVNWALEKPIISRFIEVMPIGEAVLRKIEFVDLSKIRSELVKQFGMIPDHDIQGNGPARYWQVPGSLGRMGFITPLSDKYCETCGRVRLDSQGRIYPCLAYNFHVPVGKALRQEGSERANVLLRAAILGKPKEHQWEKGATTAIAMSSLGG